MPEKDYQLYGTKVLNFKTQEIGLLIYIWENKFADKTVDFAACENKIGKATTLNLIIPEGLEMILKNKQTRETLNITLPEFKIYFAKEIRTCF